MTKWHFYIKTLKQFQTFAFGDLFLGFAEAFSYDFL